MNAERPDLSALCLVHFQRPHLDALGQDLSDGPNQDPRAVGLLGGYSGPESAEELLGLPSAEEPDARAWALVGDEQPRPLAVLVTDHYVGEKADPHDRGVSVLALCAVVTMREHRGRGYGRHAVTALCDDAAVRALSGPVPATRAVAQVRVGNVASERMLTTAGFTVAAGAPDEQTQRRWARELD